MHDQSLPGTGTMPSDRKAGRRDASTAEEPRLKEREGNRVYCLSLPGGSYEAEDDQASGLMHIHRHDSGGQGSTHVCSVPAGEYELDRDEAGVHVYHVPDRDNVRMSLKEQGEDACEPVERDMAMGPGHSVLPGPAGAGRGRDIGPTEYQRLQAYKQRLNDHYNKYRHWIRERTS
jgi:hypothetical protein